MSHDNFTIHQYRALKECPQGQQPGDVFDATESVGDVLISVGAAERVDDASAPDDPKSPTPPAGRHKRRDLRAEE